MSDSRLPVALLTGFLGAGKSTLLNKVLSDASSGKIAVIVNEFGEVGLDHDLIEDSSEEVVLMSSGCICCSIRGDLAETLAGLITRRASGELDFDRVVIETTGLADPAPVRQTLLSDRYLSRVSLLDGVITLVDAAHGQSTLDDQFEAVSQVATADLVVVTKTDLVSAEQADALKARLQSLNPTARLVDVNEVIQSPQMLWGLSGMRRGATTENALAWVSHTDGAATSADPLANLSGLSTPAPTQHFSAHDSRINTASITLDTPLEDAVFDKWLDTLVALKGRDLLRVKGIVFLKGMDIPFVFHGVQHIFDAPVPLKNWPEGDTTSRIVVIARDMTDAQLQRSFDMLRATKVAPQSAVFPGWNEVKGDNWSN